MTQPINISVIIPAYLRDRETADCINYVIKSKSKQYAFFFEFVVVDDSPNNDTKDAVHKITYGQNSLRYIRLRRHTGIGEKRNIAIAKAKNELLLLADSDIEVSEDAVDRLVAYMENNPTIARITGQSIFTNDTIDRPTKWDRFHTIGDAVYAEGIFGRYELLYKGSFIAAGGYDPLFAFRGEGTDISIRYWRAGFPLGYCSEARVTHNEKAKASATRSRIDGITEMYRSLQIICFKYGVGDPESSTNFINSHLERNAAYGSSTEFYSIIAASKSYSWVAENYGKLLKRVKREPKEYDFKPFDVFTNRDLLSKCINSAELKIRPFYKKVFPN